MPAAVLVASWKQLPSDHICSTYLAVQHADLMYLVQGHGELPGMLGAGNAAAMGHEGFQDWRDLASCCCKVRCIFSSTFCLGSLHSATKDGHNMCNADAPLLPQAQYFKVFQQQL